MKLLKCGFDEAGRGPVAGPVMAGAVILPDDFPIDLLNDSKKLSEKKRIIAENAIKEKACWGLGVVDHKKIDEINILQASMLAMELAYEELKQKLPKWAEEHNISISEDLDECITAMTDGNTTPNVKCQVKAEPKADGKYPEVMAASIIAKNERDRVMVEYDKLYPQYNYAKHKGYPTAEHLKVCREIGPSPIQRLSFNIKPKG